MFKLLCSLLIFVNFTLCEPPPINSSHKKPVIFPTAWSSKANVINKQHNALMKNSPRTLVIQIRSDSAMPSLLLKQRPLQHVHGHHHNNHLPYHQHLTRGARPIKMAISPHFVVKSAPLISKLARKPKPIVKIKLNNGSVKPPENYVYEKPTNSPLIDGRKKPIENSIHLTNTHFGPIHTIPAPNLAYASIHGHEPETHSYQVTEELTNDQTIHDPFSGQNKYFAPDPDPSIPAAKIQPALDPFSIPSNGKPLPYDIQSNYLPSTTSGDGTITQPLLQFVNPVLNPSYHQYYTLQASAFNKAPLSAYNPTYLVTQSNNLFNQHQQQLFKPNPNYLNTNFLTPDPIHDVASNGQMLEAARNPANQIHPQYSQGLSSTSENIPTFAALVGAPAIENHINENAIDQQNAQSGFVVSNYFDNTHNPQSYQQYIQSTQRERENDRALSQAHLDLHNQLIVHNAQQYAYEDQTQSQTEAPSNNAYDEHQKLLEQQLGSSPLRIFVPDDEQQTDSNQILQKRSDDYSQESNTEPDDRYTTEDYYSMEDTEESKKSRNE